MIRVAVDDDDVVALKDCCSQRDASVSGVGLFMKMSNNGTHGSIFFFLASFLFSDVKPTGKRGKNFQLNR